MTAPGSIPDRTRGTPATHVARGFARALRRAFGPATIGVTSKGAGAAPVYHPPGVIRIVTPAELAAANVAGGEATSP